MGCGSSSGRKDHDLDSGDIGIIHEESSKSQPDEAAPAGIKQRPAPSMKHHTGLPSLRKNHPYQSILKSIKHEDAHILVVDDDTRDLELILGWFRQAKYNVTSCCTGEEAKAVIAGLCKGLTGADKVQGLDLVLMDVHMGTDNCSVLDEFVNNPHCSSIPVVVCGSEVSSQQAERIIRRGAADFVFKPMSRGLILKTVHILLQNIVELQNTEALKKIGDQHKMAYTHLQKASENRKHQSQYSHVSSFSQSMIEQDYLATIPKAHVLVIGLDVGTTGLLQQWLEKKNNVTVCRSSESATSLLAAEKFDLVLSETQLEGNKSGLDVLEGLNNAQSTINLPLILISLEDTPTTEMSHSILMGCENYLIKPLSREVTMKKVDTVLLAIAQFNLANQYMERAQKYENLMKACKEELGDEVPQGFGNSRSLDPL